MCFTCWKFYILKLGGTTTKSCGLILWCGHREWLSTDRAICMQITIVTNDDVRKRKTNELTKKKKHIHWMFWCCSIFRKFLFYPTFNLPLNFPKFFSREPFSLSLSFSGTKSHSWGGSEWDHWSLISSTWGNLVRLICDFSMEEQLCGPTHDVASLLVLYTLLSSGSP